MVMVRERNIGLFGAASGLLASILMFSAGVVKDIQVAATSSSSTIASVLVDSQQTILIGTYMLMLGVLFFLLFLGFVRGQATVTGHGLDWLSRTAFGAGLVGAAMLLLSAHFGQALMILPSYGGETQVAKSLYLLDWNWYLLVEAIPIAVFVGASSANALLSQEWPMWISWPGLAISLLLVLPYVTGGGIMLSYLWIAALSIYLVKDQRRMMDGAAPANRAGA